MSQITLFPFQQEPYEGTVTCLRSFHETGVNRGRLIEMPGGTGKTFVFSLALAEAIRKGYLSHPEKELQACKILVITVAKAITQTERVLLKAGVRDFLVTSHASMGRSFGEGMLTWTTRLRGNMLVETPVWDKDTSPDIIILDESQSVKNENAILSEIIESAVKQGKLVLMVSATPFAKPCETTITNLALKLIASRGDNQHFMSQFAVRGAGYTDYSRGTLKNYNDYILARGLKLTAKDIKFKHRCFNRCIPIDFESSTHRRMYEDAYDEYLKELADAGKLPPSEGRAAIWAAEQKYWQASERIRGPQLAKKAQLIQNTTNKQMIIAVNYLDSLDLVQATLIEVLGIKPERISIIKGGRNCQPDIDKFQYGKSDYCLLTLSSGGAGLSLHHEHKQARPRYGVIPPNYSPIRFAQLLWRAHRINSLSTTYQDCVYYQGTIEEKVAARVERGLKALIEMISNRETFLDIFHQKSKEDLKEIEDALNKDILKDIGEGDEDEGNTLLNSLPLEAMASDD